MKRHGHVAAASLIALVLAAMLSACGGSGSTNGSGTPTGGPTTTFLAPTSGAPPASPNGVVPPVNGVAVDVAVLYVQQAGLKVGQQVSETNTDVPDGFVITSQPPVGDKESLGTVIELIISKGSAACQPPGPSCTYLNRFGIMTYILGDTLPEATTSLALSGFTLGTSTLIGSSAPAGTIVCTNPPAGATFSIQEPINVGISSGVAGVPATSGCGGLSPSVSPTPNTSFKLPSCFPCVTITTPGVTVTPPESPTPAPSQ